MTNEQFIRDLLAAAQKAGIGEAEAYYNQSESFQALVNKGELEQYEVNTSGGLSLRGLVGGKMGTAYTEAFDASAIDMLVQGVLQSAALITDEDEQFIFAGSPAYETVDGSGDLGEPSERIDMALTLDRVGRGTDPRVTEMQYAMLQTGHEAVRIVNTHGLNLSHEGDYCFAFASVVAREGERVSTGGMVRTASDLKKLDPEAIAKEAVEEAVFQLGASPCESGAMPVIFNNYMMTAMLECFSGVFSAEAAQKGLSLLKDREGEMIAAPCVTIVDDPLKKGAMFSRPFDDEGVATYTKRIVEGGVLRTLLHNLKTAKKAGCASTGNAAKGSYASPVTVAPRNMTIQKGDKDLPALCAEVGQGFVITDLDGLHAGTDEVSGDFSLLAKGYLIEDGKKGRAIEQVTVAGNFFQMLKDIVAVGSDAKQSMSGFECPSVWVRSLSVAGK